MKAIQTKNAIKAGGKHFKAHETLLVGRGKDISLKDAKYLLGLDAVIEVVAPSKKKVEAKLEDETEEIDIDKMNEKELRKLAEEEGINIPDDVDVEMIRTIIEEAFKA